METLQDVTRMRLVGGSLALDFVNTRTGPPVGPADDDALTDYLSLVDWAVYAGSLVAAEAPSLRDLARDDPAAADAVFAHALRTRDHLDDLFRALATQREPDPDALSHLQESEADALAHARFESAAAFSWTWRDDRTLARPLRPVVHAAVELLTGLERERIKRCGGCRFLFYDETKNRSRRWCSMDDCGTTEKIRRYVAARRSRTA